MAPNADLRPFQMAALCSALWLTRTTDGLNGLRDLDDAPEQRRDLVRRALDLDDQQRFDVERIAGLGEGLADMDRGLVHELDGDRNDAGGDDRRDRAGPRPRSVAKPSSIGRAPSACAQDAHRRLGDDAELAFRADDQPQQIVARLIEMVAADLDDAPSISTILRPSTLLVVTPYLRQCAPPEFMAMLPASVQASWLDGSGA